MPCDRARVYAPVDVLSFEASVSGQDIDAAFLASPRFGCRLWQLCVSSLAAIVRSIA